MRPIYNNKSEVDSAYNRAKSVGGEEATAAAATNGRTVYDRMSRWQDRGQTDAERQFFDLSSTLADSSHEAVDTTPLFSPSQLLKLKKFPVKHSYPVEERFNYQQYQTTRHQPERVTLDLNNNEAEISLPKTMSQDEETANINNATTATVSQSSSEKEEVHTTAVNSGTDTTDRSETFTTTSNTVINQKTIRSSYEPQTTRRPSEERVPSSPPTPKPVETRFSGSTSSSFNKDSYASESYSPQYRSTISPRHTVISRRSNVERGQNYSTLVHYQYASLNDSAISMRPAGAQTAATQALKESRQKEKQQLGELNDRFAGYVERVRFLEAQNKKLQMELSILKGKWGTETKQIEQMYKIELEEARSVLNDTSKTKDCVQYQLTKQEGELDSMRKKYIDVEHLLDKEKQRIAYLQEQIAANESEIGLLRRRLADLNDEEKRFKQEAARMLAEIQRVSFELETEMKNRLMLENDKQSLEEELIFLKEVHTKEIEELKHLQFQQQGLDPALFFKNELSHAIKEIRDEYESLNQSQRSELEGWYRIKVSEIHRKNAQRAITSGGTEADALNREQARKLRLQISDSRRDVGDLKAKNADLESRIQDLEAEIKREAAEGMEAIAAKDAEINVLKDSFTKVMADYDELMLSKSDLESEIRTYRKLLEGEEDRDGLKQIVENIEKRAKKMSVNSNINNNTSSMVNTSYSGSTSGHTSVLTRRSQSSQYFPRQHQFRTTTF